jgi:lipid A 3-O-deacylase
LLAIVSTLACATAQAQTTSTTDSSKLSLHVGTGFHQKRLGINWESAPYWSTTLLNKKVALSNELGFALWSYDGPKAEPQTRSLAQLSAIPLFRWWVGNDVFLEGGIGATLVSKNELGPRNLSTGFQFGDHVGFGYRMSEQTLLGLRYSHYSNASIKKPNNGLDTFQFTFASGF